MKDRKLGLGGGLKVKQGGVGCLLELILFQREG